jgi:Mitochondrial carrier protein
MFFRAASFATFYSSLNTIVGEDQSATPSQYILAGGLTGFCISFIEVPTNLQYLKTIQIDHSTSCSDSKHSIAKFQAPIDLVKTKLQIQIFAAPSRSNTTSLVNVVKKLVSQHGTLSLWQGLNATLIRNIPANAVFFPGMILLLLRLLLLEVEIFVGMISPQNTDLSYAFSANEIMKREIVRRDGRTVADLTVPERMFSGACAGLCYWVGTFPLDAIKVR